MYERSMNWAFKIIKTSTIFCSDPDATTFTHGFSTSNRLVFDRYSFLRQSPGEQVSLSSPVYVQNPSYLNSLCIGIFINFTAFGIDSCKAWKIYNFKIRLGEW